MFYSWKIGVAGLKRSDRSSVGFKLQGHLILNFTDMIFAGTVGFFIPVVHVGVVRNEQVK